MPTNDQLSTQQSETLKWLGGSTSEVHGLVYEGRTAPTVNLATFVACNATPVNSRYVASLAFGIQNPAIDQAFVGFGGKVRTQAHATATEGSTTIVDYVRTYLACLRAGSPAKAALDQAQDRCQWMSPYTIVGDEYTRLALVYLTKEEYRRATAEARNRWFYAPDFSATGGE